MYTGLFYDQQDDDLFYSDDDDLMYSAEDYEYRLYLEPFNVKAGAFYEIKAEFPAQQGTRGIITDLKFRIDAPDIIETFDDVSISSSNTTITSNKMQYIKNVNITLQDDSSGAVTTRILSKVNNTATIAAYNDVGTKVNTTADIIVKGFNN